MPVSERLDAEVPDRERHLEFAARQLSHTSVAPWHGGVRTRAEVRTMLVEQARQARECGFCLWWWRDRAADELVGFTGLNRAEVEEEPVVEVGWSIARERWRQGFATEAARASIAWGFDRVGLEEIVSFALIDNRASQGVMKQAGMAYVRDFERRGLPHVLYRVQRQRTR